MAPDDPARPAYRPPDTPLAWAAGPGPTQAPSAGARRIAALIAAGVRDPGVRHYLEEALRCAGHVREAMACDLGTPGAALACSGALKRSLARAYGAAPVGERPLALASAIANHALAPDDPEHRRLGRLEARVWTAERRRARQERFDAVASGLVNSFGETPELQIILSLAVLCARATLAGRRDLFEHASRVNQRLLYALAEHRRVLSPPQPAAARPQWDGVAAPDPRPDAPHGVGSGHDAVPARARAAAGHRPHTAHQRHDQERDRDAPETDIPWTPDAGKIVRGHRAGASGQRRR